MLWRVTLDGRRFLANLEGKYRNRKDFAEKVDIGRNQAKPLIEVPNHSISDNTIAKIRNVAPDFTEGIHYVPQANADQCEVRLARDRVPAKNLSRHDQRGLASLYDALLQNPDFANVTPVFDSAAEFRRWFKDWGNASEDMPAEQFFVYRLYGETVISFLYGERYLRNRKYPLELFAIWYLVGSANAFYDGSPVDLDEQADADLPIGERQAATSLMIRLLEELRADNTIDYLCFDIVAAEMAEPESHGRMLLRIYARAETEVQKHFADPFWRDCQFFVLDFPCMLPRWDEKTKTFTVNEHRLICCPTRPAIRQHFQGGKVPAAVWLPLLTNIYRTFWDYYDTDNPARIALQQFTEASLTAVKEACTPAGGVIASYSLSDYRNRYRKPS